MKTFPLETITGSGLGISATSLQTGRTYPAPGMGEAELRCLHNICTGNLVIFDHETSCEERNFPVELQYIYNSQAKNPASVWRLSHRQLNVPDNISPLPQAMTLVEIDGQESNYIWSASSNCYFSPADASGRASLRFDESKNIWIWFHPVTRITEYYDSKGRLVSRCDGLNRETAYEYEDKNPLLLTGIKTPGGNHYTLNRTLLADGNAEETLSVLKHDSKEALLLRKWHFDSHRRLNKSDVLSPDGAIYSIHYKHSDKSDELHHLHEIRQTDGSNLSFKWKAGNKLASASHGLGDTQRTMEFQSATAGSDSTHEVRSGCYSLLLFTDAYNRLTRKQELYGAPMFSEPPATTVYNWKNDRVESVVSPDDGVERFTWQQEGAGLLVRHQLPLGRDIRHVLDAEHDFLHTNTIETAENGLALISRKVFDHNLLCEGQHKKGGTALRFIISPEGRVTEYRYDAMGDLHSERTWLDALHTEKNEPEKCIAVSEMEIWTGAQDASRVSLTRYDREAIANTTKITRTIFAAVDSEGNGIPDKQHNDILITTRDIHGSILEESSLQSMGYAPAITTRKVDALKRPLTVTNPLKQTTTHTWDLQEGNNSLYVTVHPDGRKESVLSNNLGLAEHRNSALQDGKQTRRTSTVQYAILNNNSRTIKSPDGTSLHEFFDGKGETIFTMDESGRLTGHHHDRIHNIKTITQYAGALNPAATFFGNHPSTTSLQKALIS